MLLKIILLVVFIIGVGVISFLHGQQFGRTPRGERLERVKQSPNYYDGGFKNLHDTPQLTSDKGLIGTAIGFLFKKKKDLAPGNEIPVIKTDLHALNKEDDLVVWFGHSSYLIQTDGKRILVDPVFSKYAAPVWFYNRAFKGTTVFHPDDLPEIDYLIISHDHWDHLDYPTMKALKPKIKHIICPLGVGEHFERWKFDLTTITEMDWGEETANEAGFEFFCLPARHFSGRGLKPNQSLWASFLIKTPTQKIYIGGDSGYDTHFEEIGNTFGGIDLAFLENGQYDAGWKYIHMMPEELITAAKNLQAKKVFPVHNSKFALANHAWRDPMQRVYNQYDAEEFTLLTPQIGEIVYYNDSSMIFNAWWEEVN